MMAEVGLYWKLVSLADQWFERVFGKFRSICSFFAYNKAKPHQTTVLQPGGVGIIAVDDTSHREFSKAETKPDLADGPG
jgi:hypothetical protein